MAEVAMGCQDPKYRAVSLTENYCLTPDKPVGYMIHQTLDVSIRQTPSVRSRNYCILNEHSRVDCVKGNEAGVGGGVIAKINRGMCRPARAWAEKVWAEGGRIIAHDTIMEMNCFGPDGPHDTEGVILADAGSATVSDPSKLDAEKWNKDGTIRKEWLDENATKRTEEVEYGKDSNGKPLKKEVDVYEVDGPVDPEGKLGGYSPGSDEDYVVVKKRPDFPLGQQSTEVHELQHWKDKQLDPDMASHQTEINARQAEIDWRNTQKGKDAKTDRDIEELNRQDQQEIEAFKQLDKNADQIKKEGLSPHGVKVVNGVYCKNNYEKRDEYKDQCAVLDKYDRENDEEAKAKEKASQEQARRDKEADIKSTKEKLEEMKKKEYDKHPNLKELYKNMENKLQSLEKELANMPVPEG